MINAHVPPFPSEGWVTLQAVVTEYGLPVALIEQAIARGQVTARMAGGETVVKRTDVQALRLRLMAKRECKGCE